MHKMCRMRQIGPALFFGPSGGKSDAADPFLKVPMSIFEISGRHVSRCLGGNREAKSIAAIVLSIELRVVTGEARIMEK